MSWSYTKKISSECTLTGVENSTGTLVSTSARQCRTRKDIPGTCPTGRVYTSTHRRENPMTAM